MTKSEIFTLAWKIARKGQKEFGGNASEYISESLKLAYQIAKGAAAIMFKLEIAGGSKHHKSWVAQIKGTDAHWGFKREFIKAAEYGVWELEDGVYNIKDASKNDQQFLVVKDGQAVEIKKEEVLAYV